MARIVIHIPDTSGLVGFFAGRICRFFLFSSFLPLNSPPIEHIGEETLSASKIHINRNIYDRRVVPHEPRTTATLPHLLLIYSNYCIYSNILVFIHYL